MTRTVCSPKTRMMHCPCAAVTQLTRRSMSPRVDCFDPLLAASRRKAVAERLGYKRSQRDARAEDGDGMQRRVSLADKADKRAGNKGVGRDKYGETKRVGREGT